MVIELAWRLFFVNNLTDGEDKRRKVEQRDTGCELRVTRCGLRVASCEIRVAGCEIRVAGCEIRVAGYEIRVTSCGFWVHLLILGIGKRER